jgi:hypothetical protein
VTKIQFDKNDTKAGEKRYLDEIKTDRKIEHATEDDETVFRTNS